MPQIVEGIRSGSAGQFGQNLLNQAGGARAARIRDLMQKKEMLFGELERIRREREIEKQQTEARKAKEAELIGQAAGAVVGIPLAAGANLPTALSTIGATSSIGGSIGSAFGGNPQPGQISQGFKDAANFFAENPIFNPPKITSTP